MFNVRRTRPTFVFFFIAMLVALPSLGNAQNSVFTHGDDFTTDLLNWNDPVYPSSASQKASLRSASAIVCDDAASIVDGEVFDASEKNLLIGVQVFCLNTKSEVIASTETNATGTYQFRLPKGKYSIAVSKLKYIAETKTISVTSDTLISLNFELLPITTSAGYMQVLTGALAEGNLKDITLENSKVAMSIADGSQDQQLGLATKGKPLDLSTTAGMDGFDWINLPLISTKKLSGISGSLGSQSKNVQFNTVKILSSTATTSKVLAEGACTDLPLKVKNLYVVKPDQEWFDVTTTIQNMGDSAVSFWLGDAMDNDENGQTSVYPIKQFNTSVIVSSDEGLDEFFPAEPWMGCFGKSNQVFGIFYKGDFAKGFLISANTYRTVSQKFITIQPGGLYTLIRQIAAVPVKADQTHSLALRSCFETSYDDWGLGSVLRVNKTSVAPGDTIKCSLSITNLSKYNVFEDVGATLLLPAFWKGNADTLFFGDLMPLKSVEAVWEIVPTEGSGNTILTAQGLAWHEPFTNSERTVFVGGEGWYAGDNHIHSKYSDGWGTVSEVAATAKLNGLSFLSCTDHNTTLQDSAVNANCTSEMLVMTGCEVTPNYKLANNWGHAVSLFSNKMIPFSNTPSQANAQAIVNNINALNDGNGFAIMAHPYLKGCPWTYTNVTGFKGLEVWTCFTPIHGPYSIQAFNLWDKKNSAGLQQYGFAESDAHNLDMVGKPHIVAHLKKLTKEDVHNAVSNGQFYGTDGPAIRFTVDTVMMGGSLPVTSKRLVKISMKAYSAQGIDSMYLLKNGVLINGFSYSNFTTNVQQVVYNEAIPGDFYRMECTNRWCQFAFSNPVFIVPTGQDVPHVVDTISTGMTVKYLTTNMYLFPNPCSDFVQLKTNQLSNAAIIIYDANGKVWQRETLRNESEKTLDVRSLPRGVYIVKINEKRLKLILR
jgi:hypothetical protein